MPIKNPPHPGDFIRTEIIEPAGLSVTAAAAALQCLAACAVQPAQWQGGPLRRYGAPHRESFRSEDGHAYADAGLLRHRPDPQA